MKTIDLLKELASTVTEKFTDLYERVSKNEKSVLTMKVELSDEFKKSIQDLRDSVPEGYDDSAIRKELEDTSALLIEDILNLKKSIPEPIKGYDDSELKEKLTQIKKSMSELKEEFVPSETLDEKFGELKEYDDSAILDKLKELDDSMQTYEDLVDTKIKTLTEFISEEFMSLEDAEKKFDSIKEYDDSELKDKFLEISKALVKDMENTRKGVEDVITDFQGRQDTLFDEVSKRVTYEMPIPVHFDGEPLTKGTFVLWENSLWLNKMEDNSSVPGLKNHSFMQIVAAPKEITHKGLFKEGDEEDYWTNDIVMKDNASWIAIKDKPGELPGKGWKLLAKGIKGRKGDRGDDGKSEVVETDQTKAIEDLQDEIFILKGKLDAKDTK